MLVEKALVDSDKEFFKKLAKDTEIFSPPMHEHSIDVCVTYGGDGTILYAANYFQNRSTPPILTISGGTLGFMCVYTLKDLSKQLVKLFNQLHENLPVPVERKMRLFCSKVCACGVRTPRLIDVLITPPPSLKIVTSTRACVEERHVINEVVIERGQTSKQGGVVATE